MFTVTPTYKLLLAQESLLLTQIVQQIGQALSLSITGWRYVGIGQNPTYQLYVKGEVQPRYLLKIPTRKGYPSVANLRVCYNLLRQSGIGDYRIVYHSTGSEIVPYGFFVQPWLVGTALDPSVANTGDFVWLSDFLAVLKQVHSIEMSAFGYLADGPQYESLQEYFLSMDEVIDHSFGQVLALGASIWDLERLDITTRGFLRTIFATVRQLAQQIQSPVRPVLLHGDMLPSNLLYTANGPMLIDWDECRAGWWGYEIARTLYYYPSAELLRFCLDHYDPGLLSKAEIRIGIQLEHVRQSLRELCISTFNVTDRTQARTKVRQYEAKILSYLR
ncbi:MAG: aminoglycoside phosphotransferase family protein [Caldilineaceae bacterium]